MDELIRYKIDEELIKLESIKKKATVLNFPLKKIETYCGHYVYILKLSSESILYIPDDVRILTKGFGSRGEYNLGIGKIDENLKVIGGNNLESSEYMFHKMRIKTLDLRLFNTEEIRLCTKMFYSCRIDYTDLSNIELRKVNSLDSLFEEAVINCDINLNNLKIEHLVSINYLFDSATVNGKVMMDKLNIDRLSLARLSFSHAEIQELYLGDLDLSLVIDKKYIFDCHLINKIHCTNENTLKLIEEYKF